MALIHGANRYCQHRGAVLNFTWNLAEFLVVVVLLPMSTQNEILPTLRTWGAGHKDGQLLAISSFPQTSLIISRRIVTAECPRD